MPYPKPKGSPKTPRRKPKYLVSPGDRFGMLSIVGEAYAFGTTRLVAVRCDCGTLSKAVVPRLFKTGLRNCGCVHGPVTMLTHDGKTQTSKAWAKEVGLTAQTLCTRLGRGWSIERCLTEPRHARGTQLGVKHARRVSETV